jgi:hypothetical protein
MFWNWDTDIKLTQELAEFMVVGLASKDFDFHRRIFGMPAVALVLFALIAIFGGVANACPSDALGPGASRLFVAADAPRQNPPPLVFSVNAAEFGDAGIEHCCGAGCSTSPCSCLSIVLGYSPVLWPAMKSFSHVWAAKSGGHLIDPDVEFPPPRVVG